MEFKQKKRLIKSKNIIPIFFFFLKKKGIDWFLPWEHICGSKCPSSAASASALDQSTPRAHGTCRGQRRERWVIREDVTQWRKFRVWRKNGGQRGRQAGVNPGFSHPYEAWRRRQSDRSHLTRAVWPNKSVVVDRSRSGSSPDAMV